MTMKLLVCGATGYLGSHVAAAARARGHEVLGIARSVSSAAKLRAAGIEPASGDLIDLSSIVPLIDRVDAVIFIAQLMLEEEFAAANAVLSRMEGTGKTFIFTSGTGLISQRTDGDWSEDSFAEDDPFVPSKYIGARLDTELMVRGFAERGVRAMVVRPPLMWGNGGCRTIEHLYSSVARTGAVCYLGAGLNLYSNVHVEDLADLFMLALEKGVSGALYHCVSGEENYRSMAEAIGRHLGVPTRSVSLSEAIEIWDKFTALIAFGVCSRSRSPRARRELGWKPSPDKLDILTEVINPAYRERMNQAWCPPSASA
jgi:nucleoside-diphosphate-sugar epimerase